MTSLKDMPDFNLPDKIKGMNLTKKDSLILQMLHQRPRSINDLAEELDANYHTVRRYVKKLEQMNLVTQEAAFTEHGAALWKTSFSEMVEHIGELVFKDMSGKPKKLSVIAKQLLQVAHLQDAGLILTTLWVQSEQEKAGLEMGYRSGPPVGKMLGRWKEIIERLEVLLELLKNIQAAPIWDGDAASYYSLGDSYEEYQELADRLWEKLE